MSLVHSAVDADAAPADNSNRQIAELCQKLLTTVDIVFYTVGHKSAN